MTALKAPCQHRKYDEHWRDDIRVTDLSEAWCPGGTVLPSDSLVIVKEDGWPDWALRAADEFDGVAESVLDALAAAQEGGN